MRPLPAAARGGAKILVPLQDLSGQSDLLDDLYARARQGDQAAWADLVGSCYPKILRVVRRRLRSTDDLRKLFDSTDFVNDVFTSLAAQQDRLEFDSFRALIDYLARVAETKIVDEYRRQRTQKRDVALDLPMTTRHGGPIELPSPGPTPSQEAVARETHDRLVSGLSGPERQAVELKATRHSNREIAERTGWPMREVQRFFHHLGLRREPR